MTMENNGNSSLNGGFFLGSSPMILEVSTVKRRENSTELTQTKLSFS
jgi:hypothetical protein